jgi:CcmD family protein
MRTVRSLILTLALLAVLPAISMAQGEAGTPGGLAAYRNVFIAYAFVWILVGGWIFSIGRRLSAVSRRLDG